MGGYNVYIDGTLQASSPDGGAGGDEINPTGPIRLCGREQSTGFNDKRYFLGQVAHFSVWDSALSPDDVEDLYLAYVNQYDITQVVAPPTPDDTCHPASEQCDICNGA